MPTKNLLSLALVIFLLWGCNSPTTHSPEVLNLSDGIDYKIESLSFSSSEGSTLLANTNITGAVIIKNNGLENGSATSINIFMSEDSVFAHTDDVLVALSIPIILAGESTAVNFDLTVPVPVSDGYYYWGVIVDPDNELDDTDIKNNQSISRFYVSNSNIIASDIGVTSMIWTVSEDTVVSPGTILDPEILLENIGNGVSGKISYTFYLSDDANITASDTLITSGIEAPLEPSENSALSNNFVIPFTAADGYYYLGIIFEETENTYSDSDLTNNITFRRFYFLNPAEKSLRPDLSINGITWSEISNATVISGTWISGSLTITNSGTFASNASWFGIYTSSDDQITGLDTYNTFGNIPVLQSGESVVLNYSFQLGRTTENGSFYVGIWIDDNDDIIEIDEANNTATLRINVENPVIQDDLHEPNDTINTATFADEGTVYTGVQLNEDWFEINVSSGFEHLLIGAQFISADGDIDIELWDANGVVLIEAQSITDNEFIDFQVASAGLYYIKVYWGDQGNNYTLQWDAFASNLAGASMKVMSTDSSLLQKHDIKRLMKRMNQSN